MEQETMESAIVESASLGQDAAYDLTIWGLFADADLVVQLVLVLLLLASFWTSAIFNSARRPHCRNQISACSGCLCSS